MTVVARAMTILIITIAAVNPGAAAPVGSASSGIVSPIGKYPSPENATFYITAPYLVNFSDVSWKSTVTLHLWISIGEEDKQVQDFINYWLNGQIGI